MKMTRLIYAVSAILTIATANVAMASEQVGQLYGTGMLTYIDPDSDREVKSDLKGIQLGLGKAFSEHFNGEVELDYMDLSGKNGGPDTKLTGIAINGMYLWNRDSRFTPYVLAGAGYLKSDPKGFAGQKDIELQAGPGFLLDLGSDRLSLRAELLGRWVDNSPSSATDILVNIGVQYAFGSKSSGASSAAPVAAVAAGAAVVAAANNDADGDGVFDADDKCPGTPAGTEVDANGCDLGAGDDDGDGVLNRDDQCPATPTGVEVDEVGCGVSLSLSGANFGSSSADLTAAGKAILAEVAVALGNNEDKNITVVGYTDSSGSATGNQKLSEARADSVKAYLVSEGVAASRITTAGKGASDPIDSNETESGKAANRRVVLSVDE